MRKVPRPRKKITFFLSMVTLQDPFIRFVMETCNIPVQTTTAMIDKSSIGLNNYDKLQFLDTESRNFLEKINVTNLIDQLSLSDNEISDILNKPEYRQFDTAELSRVFRNRGH